MGLDVTLNYGRTALRFEVPDSARILDLPEIGRQVTPEGFAADLAPFLEKISIGRTIAIAVGDKTRRCGYDQYLPILLNEIMHRGVAGQRITLYIAYGTHSPQSEAESKAMYGPAWSQSCFVQHDCNATAVFRELGTTTRGTPVRLRAEICDADTLITFGAISHHYFAGYGGGRKLIFPGLGEKQAIYHNHGLFLDRKNRCLSKGCAPGVIDGNPLAEDLAEVEAFRPADLSIHGILDGDGNLCRLITGQGEASFQTACRAHAVHTEVNDPACYDMVLASCGGFPKDINFIQSHKAVHNAAMFVKDGGTLIVSAQCRDGVGSTTFLPWFDLGGFGPAFDRLAQAYEGNGGTALAMMEKLRRVRIFLVTDLDEDLCDRIGVLKLTHASAAQMVRRHQGSLAVIAHAGLLVKTAPHKH